MADWFLELLARCQMTSLQAALVEVKRTRDHGSYEMRFRLLEGEYVEIDKDGWLALTTKGEAELIKAEAARVKRNAKNKARNVGLRGQGLKRSPDGWM